MAAAGLQFAAEAKDRQPVAQRTPVEAVGVFRVTRAAGLLARVLCALARLPRPGVGILVRLAITAVGEAQRERDRQRAAPSLTALNRRLQAEQEENARLKKALDEARAKLDAIVNIELERSAPNRPNSERPSSSEGRNP